MEEKRSSTEGRWGIEMGGVWRSRCYFLFGDSCIVLHRRVGFSSINSATFIIPLSNEFCVRERYTIWKNFHSVFSFGFFFFALSRRVVSVYFLFLYIHLQCYQRDRERTRKNHMLWIKCAVIRSSNNVWYMEPLQFSNIAPHTYDL